MSETYDPEKRFNERAKVYDDEIERIIPGYRALHNISHHILKSSLPNDANVLVCGSGTGNEAVKYALDNPEWEVTGFDIAQNMVNTARLKAKENGLSDKVEIIHGVIHDVAKRNFDGATSLLVAHFIPLEEKKEFFNEINIRLKPGGKLIIADVCDDKDSEQYENFLNAWKSFQLKTREKEDVEEMLGHVRNNLNYITVDETVSLLSSCGFTNIHHFWKSLLINGFVMEKTV